MKKVDLKTHSTRLKYAQIVNIGLNSTSINSVLALVRNFIARNHKFSIFTPNPELIVMALNDNELFRAINTADLAIPDGVGLKYAVRFLDGINLNIIPGRKLFLDLISLANKKGWKVFFLGGRGDEAGITAGKLKLNYKSIKIKTLAGPILDNKANPISERDIVMQNEAIKKINDFKPQLLFVGLGMPKQEKWISKNLSRLDVGGAMAVGGTFSYIAGYSKFPPKWMERSGLEWFWRLISEPWRISRIVNAVIIFPLRIFWYKVQQRLV